MAKRFTETDKWKDSWFRKLPPKMKILWLYILDQCDSCGNWEFDLQYAGYQIGSEVSEEEFSDYLAAKFVWIDEDKLHVRNFIPFQYGQLKKNVRPHVTLMQKLKKIGLLHLYYDEIEGEIPPAYRRVDIGDSKKKRVLERDGLTCQYCGVKSEKLGIDHIVPVVRGGSNEVSNLVACCWDCNRAKNDRSLADYAQIADSRKFSQRILDTLTASPQGVCSTPKEQEEEKEEEQEPEKEKEKEPLSVEPKKPTLSREVLAPCCEAWGQTLESFRIRKDPWMDAPQIGQLIQRHGAERTRLALLGAAREEKTDRFDPAKHCGLARVIKHFDKFVNLGAQDVPRVRAGGYEFVNPPKEGTR